MAKAKPKSISHSVGQVTIRKRPGGRFWRVLWRQGDEWREKSLRVTNIDVAREKAQEFSNQLERGNLPAALTQAGRGIPFRQLVTEFKEKYRGWSPRTFKGQEGTLRAVVGEWGPLPINQINTVHIDTFLAGLVDNGATAATRNRYLATLRTVFRCAIQWGYMAYSPASGIRSLSEAHRTPEPLSTGELAALLDALEDGTLGHRVSLIAGDTGLRRSEIQRLEWRDVDFRRRAVRVRETKNRTERVIPLTRRLTRLFIRLRRAAPDAAPASLVCPFDSIKKSLKTAGEKIGVDGMHLHRLRHTFITRLLDRGVPLERVQYLAGHKDIKMTLHYNRTRPGLYRDAIRVLEE